MKRTFVALSLALAAVSGTADAHLVNGGTGFFSGDARPTVLNRIMLGLRGKEKTVITVKGDGADGSDLDCYLYEGDFKAHTAKFVVRDDSTRDGCRLEVTPPRADIYDLLVQNVGDKTEHYTVTVN
jgi:hypothetical protein